MRLLKVLTIVLLMFFSTTALYSQAPPPSEEIKEEQKVEAGEPGPAPDPSGPLEGTSVPLDGGLLMAMLAGGGIAAGLLRKSTKKKV